MKSNVSATGQTTVILVLNMKRFIAPDQQEQFEKLRSSTRFRDIIKHQWQPQLEQSDAFHKITGHADTEMETEEVGFVTGVFREAMLSDFTAPLYQVDKSAIHFPATITENWQFRKLFQPIWERWNLALRATANGMFVITLKRNYERTTPMLQIATDVVKLQMSFDIRSAQKWVRDLGDDPKIHPIVAAQKAAEVDEFLQWIGYQPDVAMLDYAPVQWQVAQEVCRQFIRDLGELGQGVEDGLTFLESPAPDAVPPIYDSYVIYRFHDLLANFNLLERPLSDNAEQPNTHVHVTHSEMHNSRPIREAFVQLIEGAILRDSKDQSKSGQTKRRFPRHDLDFLSDVLKLNTATWADELCLMASRCAIMIPDRKAREREDELFISTLPASTSQVKYVLYWDVLERMVEFVVETRVLSQLVERSSALALHDLSRTVQETRRNVIKGNLNLNADELLRLSDEAANLSRLVGVCQSLSNAQIWCRAEYALDKAKHLFDQLNVPVLLRHAEANVNNVTNLINHVDEIHLAALSERNSKQNERINLQLGALSAIIILYALPSFWADLQALSQVSARTFIPAGARHATFLLGTSLAPFILIMGGVFIWLALRNSYQRLVLKCKAWMAGWRDNE
ncbi:MAG: hypothetical protein AAF614_15035 [Chloroflexota bacterium]